MELKDLIGEHELSGVDFGTIPANKDAYEYEDANTMTFVLDGKAYCVIEDPQDGYRSSMRDIVEADVDAVKNRFAPVRVVGTYREENKTEYDTSIDDVLELRDVVTGKLVIECGTENADDYYPCYIGYFKPEHMAVNQSPSEAGKADPSRENDESQEPDTTTTEGA